MKTVLITGGAKRLGRALVRHFAQEGWCVLFTARASYTEGLALAEELGENVHCLSASISTQDHAERIAQWVAMYSNRLDLLICSASTFRRTPLEETTVGDMDALLGSNLIGPYFLCQQCLPLLKASRGAVINIADAQATTGVPFFAPYVAAKAALISITQSLAVELAPAVRVNAILPGQLAWPDHGNDYPATEKVALIEQIPAKALGEWASVVNAVKYLADAPYVTGTSLVVDGGRAAKF